jgi:5-methylthioadenosine/S-adenosylhomocysteine deaminase
VSTGLADLVLTGGTLYTLDPNTPIIDRGWIAVRDGRIVGIGTDEAPPGRTTVDCTGDHIIPGLVNTHAHLLGSFVRGMGGDRATAVGATSERPTVAIRLGMTEADAYAAARLALLEMQLSGVTTTTDSQPALYGLESQADGTLHALGESLMQAVYFRASVDRTDFFPPAHHDQADRAETEIIRLRSSFHNDRLAVGVEPMALHRVSDDLLRSLIETSQATGSPLALHGPYSPEAADHPYERWGDSVIGTLDHFGALGPATLIYHPVVVDARDINLLADRDAAVSVCTVDNLLTGSPIAPLTDLVRNGVRVGLGLDQPNDGHDMFQLMKFTLLAQRHETAGEDWMDPDDVLTLATRQGGAVLRGDIGVIAAGRWADLVVLDGSHPTMQPRQSAASNLVLTAGPQTIKRVYTKGIRIVERGRHLLWDQDEVVEAATRSMRNCLQRAGLDDATWAR